MFSGFLVGVSILPRHAVVMPNLPSGVVDPRRSFSGFPTAFLPARAAERTEMPHPHPYPIPWTPLYGYPWRGTSEIPESWLCFRSSAKLIRLKSGQTKYGS